LKTIEPYNFKRSGGVEKINKHIVMGDTYVEIEIVEKNDAVKPSIIDLGDNVVEDVKEVEDLNNLDDLTIEILKNEKIYESGVNYESIGLDGFVFEFQKAGFPFGFGIENYLTDEQYDLTLYERKYICADAMEKVLLNELKKQKENKCNNKHLIK
jgi:hypothetical protein